MTSKTRKLANLITNTGDVKLTHLDNVDAGLDSAQVSNIAEASGLTVYATKENLPTTGLTEGDQAYVSGNRRLYISNGSGWYNVALVNATPSLTIDPTGAITLSTEGTATTITLTATDSDNAVDGLTFSVESDGSFAGLGNISQDSSVFTITPLGEDSATTTSSTLTFKASDGISFGSGSRTLSLRFTVANSRYTTLLLQADNSKSDAQTDLSSNASTVGEVNQVFSTAHTPYHLGGYSGYFDASGDRTYTSSDSDFYINTDDFSYEGWFYTLSAASSYPRAMGSGVYYNDPNSFGVVMSDNDHTQKMTTYWGTGGSNAARTLISSQSYDYNQWNHVAVCREGDFIALFYNGDRIAVDSDYGSSTQIGTANTYLFIGDTGNGGNEGAVGYHRDIRFIKGSSAYDPTQSSITVPIAPLTATADTKLLIASPYYRDISTRKHALTNGIESMKSFGPYDHLDYNRTDHGGSVYFYGTDDYLTVDGGYLTTNTTWWNSSGFTIEVWLYKHNTNDVVIWDNRVSGNTNGFIFKTHSNGLYVYANNAERVSGIGTNPVNIWTHVALVCSGTTGKVFQDGKQVGSDFTIPDTASYSYFGRSQNTIGAVQYTPRGAGTDYLGYMSDLRISSGSRYSGTYTLPTEAFADDGTTVFLTCRNQHNIWDANSNHVMVTNGNVTASNTQRKFNTSSAIYFDGSGDWIDLNAAAKYKFEPLGNDFTFEWWWYPTTLSQRQWFFHSATDYWLGVDFQNSSGRGLGMWASSNGSSWNLLNADNGGNGISSTNPTLNAWNHIAFTRNGNTFTLWLNGTSIVSVSSITASIVDRSSQAKVIGSWAATNHQFPIVGYIQDFRWTNGLARYTSSFTPPTSQFSG